MTNAPEDLTPTEATPASSTGDTEDGLRLVTYFQPFYNLRSNTLQGLEALARLHDGANGAPQLPPAFLAGDERADEIRDIDLWILDDALGQLAKWHEVQHSTDLIVSVNLSRHSAGLPNLVTRVKDTLDRYGLTGERLLVDITVDTLRRSTAGENDTMANLAPLRELGVAVCLDNFTADDLDVLDDAVAASVDIIKLDARELDDRSEDELAALAEPIQSRGLPTVAAGVETQAQLDLVRRLDFEWAQGFLLGQPVAAPQALQPPAQLS